MTLAVAPSANYRYVFSGYIRLLNYHTLLFHFMVIKNLICPDVHLKLLVL